jgi:hypothetical protein
MSDVSGDDQPDDVSDILHPKLRDGFTAVATETELIVEENQRDVR